MTGTVEEITCENCGLKKEDPEARSMFLQVCLPADTNGNGKKSHSIKEAIARYFTPTQHPAACDECKGTRSSKSTITQLPEILLVQLNRQGTDSKRRYDPIDLEDIVFDQKLTKAKTDVQYELTSVTLHHRDPKKEVEAEGGHYTILVKGPGGSWTHVSDAKRNQTSDEELKTSELSRENGYIFAYRRVPYEADSDDSKDDEANMSPPSVIDLDEPSKTTPVIVIDDKSPASVIDVDELSEKEAISQPPTGSGLMDTVLTHITTLFNNHRAQNKKDWDAQGAKRKQEWDEWADERDKKKQKQKQVSQADDSGVGYDGEKLRGTLRITMTDKQGNTSLDIQMAGQIKNNRKEVDAKETKQTKPKTEKPKKEIKTKKIQLKRLAAKK